MVVIVVAVVVNEYFELVVELAIPCAARRIGGKWDCRKRIAGLWSDP